MVLAATLIGGAMLSVLMVMAAMVAIKVEKSAYATTFAIVAAVCVLAPPLIVGTVMEMMWRLAQKSRPDFPPAARPET